MSVAQGARSNSPWTAGPNPLGLTELEVATGVVLGATEAPKWPRDGPARQPLEVLFDEARKILERGRCVVAFSGGRDSSALLATLLHVARQEGFEEPTALTARWPGDEAADESAWQEHVVQELGVRRWEIITPGTDFDLLGPLCTGLLGRHGLLWPPPIVSLTPLIEATGDGVLVTGEGGDEVFGTWAMAKPWECVRSGHQMRSSLRRVVASGLPRSLRFQRARAGERPYQTWLTRDALEAHRDLLATEDLAVSTLWWPSYLRGLTSERASHLTASTQAAMTVSHGGSYAKPLLAPGFLAALARRGGRLGLGGRTAAMRAVFSPLLSEAIMSRRSKATFAGVFWGPQSRQFAKDWDGSGVDGRWVDAEALRAAWSEPTPVFGAALPLHAAWLANASRTTLASNP